MLQTLRDDQVVMMIMIALNFLVRQKEGAQVEEEEGDRINLFDENKNTGVYIAARDMK